MLITMPRIFAHSFYNPKDIGFLAMYIVTMITMYHFLNTRDFRDALVHALASAILIDIRIVGVIVPAATLGFFVLDALVAGAVAARGDFPSRRIRRMISGLRGAAWFPLLLHGVTLAVCVVAFWPVLWRTPLKNFVTALRVMSRYPWGGTVLYLGKLVSAQHLPWHYPIVWMLVTIPPLYTFLGVAGVFGIVREFLRGRLKAYGEHRLELQGLFLGAGPVLAVIVLHSCLYDGWRQLFFTYPALLTLAVSGLAMGLKYIEHPSHRSFRSAVFSTMLAAQFAALLLFMVRRRPYQNVYFNLLVPDMHKARQWFDLDYWGMSYPEGLRAVAARDASHTIPVATGYFAGAAGRIFALILKPEIRKRFRFVGTRDHPRYFLTNFRGHPQNYPIPHVFYSVRVGGEPIMTVYRLGSPEDSRKVPAARRGASRQRTSP